MKNSPGLILFIVTLPALVALGHDIYLFLSANESIPANIDELKQFFASDKPGSGFSFASLGFIWTHYSPETFQTASESFSEETWAKIKYFLTYKAFYVTGAFALFVYALVGLWKLLKRLG